MHVEDGNVERRCMRDCEDPGFGVVEASAPRDFHRRQDRLHNEPGPQAGKFVLDSSVLIEQRTDQGHRAENQRVRPDQRIQNEI